jgi:hypothetical protein
VAKLLICIAISNQLKQCIDELSKIWPNVSLSQKIQCWMCFVLLGAKAKVGGPGPPELLIPSAPAALGLPGAPPGLQAKVRCSAAAASQGRAPRRHKRGRRPLTHTAQFRRRQEILKGHKFSSLLKCKVENLYFPAALTTPARPRRPALARALSRVFLRTTRSSSNKHSNNQQTSNYHPNIQLPTTAPSCRCAACTRPRPVPVCTCLPPAPLPPEPALPQPCGVPLRGTPVEQPVGGSGQPHGQEGQAGGQEPFTPRAGAGREELPPGGAGRGRGTPLHSTPAPHARPGRQPSSGSRKKLVIRTGPKFWGATSETLDTEGCHQLWMEFAKQLFDHQMHNFPETTRWEWETAETPVSDSWTGAEPNRQFVAALICHIYSKDLPGGMKSHGYIDHFKWNDQQIVCGPLISFGATHVLSGVDKANPFNAFHPTDYSDVQPSNEQFTRMGLCLLRKMLRDIMQRFELEIEVAFNNPDGTGPRLTVINNTFIEGTICPSVVQVTNHYYQMFEVQAEARELAGHLAKVNDDVVSTLEELHASLELDPDKKDDPELRQSLMQALQDANLVNRRFGQYEVLSESVAEERLNFDTCRRCFKGPNGINLLQRFLGNSSHPYMPWIKNPDQWLQISGSDQEEKPQVLMGGAVLSLMANPSRFSVPIQHTNIQENIASIKSIVHESLKVIKLHQQFGSRQHSREGSYDNNLYNVGDNNLYNPRNPAPFGVVPQAITGASGTIPPPLLGYPDGLMRAAQELHDQLDHLGHDEPLEVLQDLLDRTAEVLQAQRKEMFAGLVLRSQDKVLHDSLQTFKTVLAVDCAKKRSQSKLLENEQRELSRTLSSTKAPILLETGANIIEWLDYHRNLQPCNKLVRTMKLKETLPKSMVERVKNENDPEALIRVFEKLYYSEDYLLPCAKQEIENLKCNPQINSAGEEMSYNRIFGYIQKLTRMNKLQKLDFSTITMCMYRLSRQRQEDFDKIYLEEEMKSELRDASIDIQEQTKRSLFLKFIELHENLLRKRLLAKEVTKQLESKAAAKDPPSKNFSTVVRPLKTKYDKRQSKSNPLSPPSVATEYKCSLCGAVGGHPRIRPPNEGASSTSIARCPKFREERQENKLAVIASLKACARCLSTTHQAEKCQLPRETHWLKHEGCRSPSGDHNPAVCPTKKT